LHEQKRIPIVKFCFYTVVDMSDFGVGIKIGLAEGMDIPESQKMA